MDQQRGASAIPGRDLSSHRVEALSELERLLAKVPFPATREVVCEELRGRTIPLGTEGQSVDACDLVGSLWVDEFSSPRHVREAVEISWRDFSDVYRPGGGG